MTVEQYERARMLLAGGASIRKAAYLVGLSHGTIHMIRNGTAKVPVRCEVKQRSRSRRPCCRRCEVEMRVATSAMLCGFCIAELAA